jgi:acetyl-CoA carboxylase carboxyltransferase component
MGYIKGKQCIVVANDATVKAGAWFPITKKNLRARNRHGKSPAYHLFSR